MSYSKFYDDIKTAKMSIRAKVLYTILLDKYELSEKKGFTNSKGQIICKMKQVEMAEAMGCCVRSVPKYIDELKLHNLILVEFGLCKMYEISITLLIRFTVELDIRKIKNILFFVFV